MKKAVLVRVGIDSTPESGKWNAPVNTETWEFAYVPILEPGGHDSEKKLRPGYEISYEQFKAPCEKFGKEDELPTRFNNKCAHLDPDFRYLTYGDAHKKAARLRNLKMVEGDILAFYASFHPIKPSEDNLIYALIGLYVLADKPKRARDIPEEDWSKNAHTRREPEEDDIVFYGKRGGLSGRLERCIRIGEWRDNGYRVTKELFYKWGELSTDYLQLSGGLPCFYKPERFHEWFKEQIKEQNISLLEQNNLD